MASPHERGADEEEPHRLIRVERNAEHAENRHHRCCGTGRAKLLTLLCRRADLQSIAIDKHARNVAVLSRLHPQVEAMLTDPAEAAWARTL